MRDRVSRGWSAALFILGSIALPKPSFAYNCAPAKACPIGEQWFTRSIDIYINDTSTLLQPEERKQLVQNAFATWSNATMTGDSQPCTDIKFNYRGRTTMGAGFDESNVANNQNVVLAAATPNDLAMFDSPDELAKTIVTYISETGQIVDADMMLNGLNKPFDEVTDQATCLHGRPEPYDLSDTVTHEAGHFIGFDHSPDPNSTMFATADPCETKKRHLTPDDVLGVCTIYPAAHPNGQCPPERFMHPCAPHSCFCSARVAQSTSSFPLAILFCALVLMARVVGRSRSTRPRA